MGLLFMCLFIYGDQDSLISLEVITELANIRSEPDIGSTIIYQLPQGTILKSPGKEGEWYAVRFKSDEGQVISGHVHESLVLAIEKEPVEKEEVVKEEKIKPIKEESLKKEAKEPEERKKEEKEEAVKEESIIASSTVPKPSKVKFDLFLSGGLNYLSGGDINFGAQGLADFLRNINSINGEGQVKPVHLSYILGGELSFPVWSKLHIGIGVDFYSAKKQSTDNMQEIPLALTFSTYPEIQAVPLRFVILYYPVENFYIKGGVEYFVAKCGYDYKFQKGEDWEQWQGHASSSGLGALGSVGTELNLTSVLSFVVEVSGRYCKIDEFSGTGSYEQSTGEFQEEDGILYSYNTKSSEGTLYPLVFIRSKKPAEAGVYDAKRATVNFSGISLKAGIKIKF